MKKLIYILIGIFIATGITVSAAPYFQSTQGLIPFVTNQFFIGTSSPSTLEYKGIFTKDLTVSGTCTGCGSGSTFPFTPTSYGNSTTSIIGFLGGLMSVGSTTFSELKVTNGTTTNATSTTLYVSGQSILAASTGNVGIGTVAPTHALTFPVSSTGIAIYNTADQTTNLDRVIMQYSGNTFIIRSQASGSGSVRDMSIGTTNSSLSIGNADNAFALTRSSSSATFFHTSINGTMTNSSGTNTLLRLNPTYNQSSTAGYATLLINPTETATGSGVKRLISAQVGSVDKFFVDNTGIGYFAGNVGIGTTSPYATLSVVGASGIVAGKIHATSTTDTSTFATAPTFSTLTSALIITGAGGLLAEYTGTSCTNQFPRSLDALGVATCATVGAADVSLANLTATDSTLTFSGTYTGATARTIGLNLGNSNAWTAHQTFTSAFFTIASSTNATTTGTMTIPVGASIITPIEGNIAIDTTTGQLRYSDITGTSRVLTAPRYMRNMFSTTTWATSGTSSPIASFGVFPVASTITTAQCYATSTSATKAFVRVSFMDASMNRLNDIVASSTIGTFTFSTNNTFTASEAMLWEVGTTTAPSAFLTVGCTLTYTIDVD